MSVEIAMMRYRTELRLWELTAVGADGKKHAKQFGDYPLSANHRTWDERDWFVIDGTLRTWGFVPQGDAHRAGGHPIAIPVVQHAG